MKRICLSALFVCFSLLTYSQNVPSFKLGLKGGLNRAMLYMNDYSLSNKNKWGYDVGIWARFGEPGTHLQTELYFSNRNVGLLTASNLENKVTLSSLNLPILIGTTIGAKNLGLRVNTGPVLILLKEKQVYDETFALAFKGKFKETAIGWQFGLGFDFGKLSIDARYEAGLSEINEANGYPPTRLNAFNIGLGFRIF